MDFREENLVTVEAHQSNPHGPMIEPIDAALLGKADHVHVERTNVKPRKDPKP